jgi:hypothetical protein
MRWMVEKAVRIRRAKKPLITPALFSHRTPPDREKREKGKDQKNRQYLGWAGVPLSR